LAHEQTPLSNNTIDSILRHQEVGRAKDLSAPPRVIRIYFFFYIISSVLNINTLCIDINMPCSPEFLLVLCGYRNVSHTSTKSLPSLLTSFLESCKNIYAYIWQCLLMCTWNLIQWTSAVTFLISFHMLSVHCGISDKIVFSVVLRVVQMCLYTCCFKQLITEDLPFMSSDF